MFAQVTLDPERGEARLLVPADAVIGGGEQTRVILMTPEGRFHPVAVQIGRSGGGTTEILSGLQGGEGVLASGPFLIASGASPAGAADRLHYGVPAGQPGGPRHEQ